MNNNKIVYESSDRQLWYDLVVSSRNKLGLCMNDDVESYLVFLLAQYCAQPEFISQTVAHQYLQAVAQKGQQARNSLREAGDIALLFAGLFPLRLQRYDITPSYFVCLGRESYKSLADTYALSSVIRDLYAKLSDEFVSMVDVLLRIREQADGRQALDILSADDFWRDRRSVYAFKLLSEQRLNMGFPRRS